MEINQQQEPAHGRLFRTLGTFRFDAGTESWIRISNAGTDGKHVIVDAIQLLPVDSVPTKWMNKETSDVVRLQSQ